jgi:glycosyltransferase involved in cell wall biosynthesis
LPLKIAAIAPTFYPAHSYGGPIRSTLQLTQGLARLGCDVRVLTTDAASRNSLLPVDTSAEQSLPGQVRVRYAHRVLLETISAQLLRWIPEYVRWSDVVYLVGVYNFPTFPTLLAARLLDKPLFWSPRGSLQRWVGSAKPTLKTLVEQSFRPVLPRTCVLHVTSEEEGIESAARLGGLPYVSVPNGVPVPERVQHEPAQGSLRIAFLGRLDPKKGIPNLLQACARLPSLGLSSYELTIAGAGTKAYEAALRSEVRSLGLTQRVHFIGAIADEDKAAFFRRMDMLVMPSFTENFGIVVAEALAHAVPAIASRASPWSDLVAHDCGLWVDNDPEGLARAIVTLSQRDLRAMGQRGRELVQRAYSWDEMSARVKASFEDMLRGHLRERRR